MRYKLLSSVLEKFKSKEMDIKAWKPHEFSGLVKQVANLEPKELHVFYTFTKMAFEVGFF